MYSRALLEDNGSVHPDSPLFSGDQIPVCDLTALFLLLTEAAEHERWKYHQLTQNRKQYDTVHRKSTLWLTLIQLIKLFMMDNSFKFIFSQAIEEDNVSE
jgi:hypothetical protein